MEYNSALKGKWLSLKESTCNVGDLGLISELGRSLEKGKANHSSILAWKIPWMEESGRLQFMGCKKLDTIEWLTKKKQNKQTKKKRRKWQRMLKVVIDKWSTGYHLRDYQLSSQRLLKSQWDDIFKYLKEKECQSRILWPEKKLKNYKKYNPR